MNTPEEKIEQESGIREIMDQSKVDKENAPEEAHNEDHISEEISLNYLTSRESWDRKKVTIDNSFVYRVALDIVNEDPDPKSIEECPQRNDWPKWKDAM